MSEPKIHSVDGLKSYILKKLGSPVVNVELTDDQLQLVIDDTLDDYIPRAYSGVQEKYVPIKLLAGIQDYLLPYDTFAVIEVNTQNSSSFAQGSVSNLFSMNQFIAADLYRPGMAKIDMLGFEMINEMVASLDVIFSKKETFDYNSISKILHIHSKIDADTPAIIKSFEKLDLMGTPSSTPGRFQEENIYNERWIKRMCIAKAKEQWGWNLLKYSGSVLPNGGSLNAEKIYETGKAEVEMYMKELHEEFELPVDFFIG